VPATMPTETKRRKNRTESPIFFMAEFPKGVL
jgi:hypothetical protein